MYINTNFSKVTSSYYRGTTFCNRCICTSDVRFLCSSFKATLPRCNLCVQSALEVYKEMVLLYLEDGRRLVNSQCVDLEPWQIIGATVITTLGAVWIKGFLFQQESNISHVIHDAYKVGGQNQT